MAHLCYVYIHQYKCLQDIELTIDPKYKCHYDKLHKRLSIEFSTEMPENFWGRGVSSIAAIVGNNGVGKSTAVEFILQAVVEGANANDIDGILVYEQNNELIVYGKEIESLPSDVKRLSKPQKICCLYYSGHFQPYDSIHNLRNSELEGNYNISDGYLLIKDVQNYSNTDGVYLNQSIASHLRQYQAKDNYRICMMLSNERLYHVAARFCKIKYVVFKENRSGAYLLDNGMLLSSSEKKIPKQRNTHTDLKQRILASHIYKNFVNLFCDIGVADGSYIDALQGWQAFMNDSDPILPQFKTYIEQKVHEVEKIYKLMGIHDALEKLDALAEFKVNLLSGYYYLEVSKDYGKIKDMCNVLERSGYLVAQYFDISYSQSLETDTILSSGETKLLDLFSRLYFAIQKDTEKFANLSAPALLILDEAEISFHPDWQRKYLQSVISFLHEMLVRAGVRFQILLTTHSPILLSDIPSCCINFLKKDGDDKTKNVTDEENTFGENVFNLYRRAFFMKEGLIGAFAAEKLNRLFERAQTGDVDAEMMKEVELIGDIRIKDLLSEEIAKHDKTAAKEYYQRKLKELEKGA